MELPDWRLPEHRVERHQFQHVDGLDAQLGRRPLDGVQGKESAVRLQRVQYHERRAAFHRVMGEQFVNFGFKLEWDGKLHRSHSPITKSNEPRIAVTSLTMWPGNRCDRMLRLTKLGERIFRRYGVPPPRLLM